MIQGLCTFQLSIPTPQIQCAFVRTSDTCCWVKYEHDDFVTTPSVNNTFENRAQLLKIN